MDGDVSVYWAHFGLSAEETYRRGIVSLTRVVPKVMSKFFFACELGTADEGECGGRWNQLLCYP